MGHFARGVTLVELLVTLAVLAILLMIGIPSYQSITTSSRTSSEINELVTHLQFARAEAVKRGQNVTVNSNNGNNWANGWVVDDPNGNPLKQQAAFQGGDTLTATVGAIAYDRNGFTANATTVTLHDSTNTLSYRKCLVVSAVGQLTLNTQGACP
ncbi:MAG: GspH/FimT family pseudopilin [Thiobacillaceae bacterium]